MTDSATLVDGVDEAASEDQAPQDPGNTEKVRVDRRGRTRRLIAHWRLMVLTVLLASSVALTIVLYVTQHRADTATDPAATSAVVRAASEGTAAVLSYKPDTLTQDLATAKSHLTGEFLTYYGKFSDEILMPAARERAVSTKASAVRAAAAEMHPDSAKVLVFVDQTTTSQDRPDAAQSASSVVVSMTKTDGKWLISAFEPV